MEKKKKLPGLIIILILIVIILFTINSKKNNKNELGLNLVYHFSIHSIPKIQLTRKNLGTFCLHFYSY